MMKAVALMSFSRYAAPNGKRIPLTDRWQYIVDIVYSRNGITVRELCEYVGMSPNTARRDLAALHERGLILKKHGRIMPCEASVLHSSNTIAESKKQNADLKTAIGRAAAMLVKPGETIMIDGGYTTYQVAAHIKTKNIHIITNSLDVAGMAASSESSKLTVIGGELWKISGSVVGWVAAEQINRLNADKAILGNDAVSVREGLTCVDSEMSFIKKTMCGRAKELIVVADHTKIGKFSRYTWAGLPQISALVTDSRIEEAQLTLLRRAGVEVIVAET